jgi:hypothetical protein
MTHLSLLQNLLVPVFKSTVNLQSISPLSRSFSLPSQHSFSLPSQHLTMLHVVAILALMPCLDGKIILKKHYRTFRLYLTNFVNYGLTRLKRFVSIFTDKLCN